MVIDFAQLNLHEHPVLILKNAGGAPLGVIGHAINIELEGNYNEISVLSFNVPAIVDGNAVPYYNDVIGMRVIEIPNIGQFTLISPEQHDDGVRKYKKCKAYSLEYEFSYKKITMAKDTYKFWGDAFSDQSNTVLGMIMELMPAWSISSVSASLLNKYRTFEINNENLYNFIKNTLQQSYGCIFDFDTLHRSVSVRDVTLDAVEQPVYLSTKNLLNEIVIHEDVENMVTRLDVNGADGIDIRDVNPTGTNKIINLDYYMTPKNFAQELIDKYNAWKQLVNNERHAYYANSINYTLAIMRLATARARLTDLEGELLNIDNQRGVIIQAISRGIASQNDLDSLNLQFNSKAQEVENAESEIEELETAQANALQVLKNIVIQCSFERYFTVDERGQLDRYIRDGEVTESSFVSTTTVFDDDGLGANLNGVNLEITEAEIEIVEQENNTIYDIKGGNVLIGEDIEAEIISGVLNISRNSGILFTASLGHGTIGEDNINGGNVTINVPIGTIDNQGNENTEIDEPISELEEFDLVNAYLAYLSFTQTDNTISVQNIHGYMFFSLNPSEYQRRSVAWDLYEYGVLLAEKLSQPTYTFSVESANFLALDDFEVFKNHLQLGGKIYLDNGGEVLKPICIGVQCSFDDLNKLTLKFGDSYVQTDTSFKLVDILDKSVSMGRTVDAGKFNYEEFSSTGVRTSVRKFMTDAIDVSKNKILSSKDQAISWDTAGLRLRKWANAQQTAYEDEQIWMNNNSVLMTDDNWQTAKMAIGKILKPGSNPQAGEYLWGLIAEMVVGRMVAGESLIIESAKTDGSGMSVFRVDGDGCRIENGDLSLIGDQNIIKHYRVNDDTNMYANANTSSNTVVELEVGDSVFVTEHLSNDPETNTDSGDSEPNDMYYCSDQDGHKGWVLAVKLTEIRREIGQKHVVIHPDVGIVLGKYPAVQKNNSGHYIINNENATMWIDSIGNVYMTGSINATSLRINGENARDSIRMGSGKLSWHSEYSDMQEDGTLTLQRAIINGTLSAVNRGNNNVTNGLLIGRAQIIGIRNGQNIFNLTMPFAEDLPIDSFVDDQGNEYTGIEEYVPAIEDFSIGDDDPEPIGNNQYQPPNNDSEAITMAATSMLGDLRFAAGGTVSIIVDHNGNLWLCPSTAGNLYIRNRRTFTGQISTEYNTFDVINGMIVV